ncbi:hypothetical protein CEXT_444651 [Caerostris extrusa]|uniref:Uncharacterized protein n=1 Tax=Caerostris extrusa TaxID=172846 RepID=A0AAV4W5X0_CAEEX|nr:hypothetical protein CEXT_444651 [Caerostris extrusa]
MKISVQWVGRYGVTNDAPAFEECILDCKLLNKVCLVILKSHQKQSFQKIRASSICSSTIGQPLLIRLKGGEDVLDIFLLLRLQDSIVVSFLRHARSDVLPPPTEEYCVGP